MGDITLQVGKGSRGFGPLASSLQCQGGAKRLRAQPLRGSELYWRPARRPCAGAPAKAPKTPGPQASQVQEGLYAVSRSVNLLEDRRQPGRTGTGWRLRLQVSLVHDQVGRP